MSEYFTYIPLTANTVARAADVNARFQSVSAGFDMLPPAQNLFEDRQTFLVDAGAPNAYVANPVVPLTAYNLGLHVVLQAANANTGPSTLNVSGLGVKEIIRPNGTLLQAGDIFAGQLLDLTYNGAKFQLDMAFNDISPAGIIEKIALAGNVVVNGNLSATSITCNGQTIDALTPFGVSLAETANDATARGLLGLGTMATEAATTYLTTSAAASTYLTQANAVATYAPKASPALTGVPTAPTAAPGTNTTQLATTAFCYALGAALGTVYLPLGGGTLTGPLTVPDVAYNAATWDANLTVPTKNAVRDEIEANKTATTSALALKGNLSGGNTWAGTQTFQADIIVPAEAYGALWNGSNEVPTKNDVYDKIEAVAAGGGGVVTFNGRSGAVTLLGSDVTAAMSAGGTFGGDLSVPDEVYGVAWDGSLEVPTKNAVYDKIQAVIAGAAGVTSFNTRSGAVVLLTADVTAVMPAFTGDVTSAAGATVNTIAANAVTLAKLADMATARFIGRITAGAGDPEEVTGTQATTLLDTFTTSLKGLAPPSGGGTANFLRADGAWAAPPALPAVVTSFNTRTGAVVLTSGDVTTALTFTPANAVHTHPFTDITGTMAGTQAPAYTGDVTSPVGSTVNTIAAGAVTYAKMQNSAAGNVVLVRAAPAAGVYDELAIGTSSLLGRGTGNIIACTLAASLSMSGAGVISVVKTPSAVTFNNGGAGGASGSAFDGSAALTVSHNTIGAAPLTPREQTVATAATVTPTFLNDIVTITAQGVTLALANWSGTAVPNHGMAIRIKDNGTARAIGYGSNYRAVGVVLPATTVANKTLYLGGIWNATDGKIDIVSVAQEL